MTPSPIPARPASVDQAMVLLVALWLVTVGAGIWTLSRYAGAAGQPAAAPASWPAASEIARQSGRPTLLMFVHPQCSCSRASLESLARLQAEVAGRSAAETVVMVAAARSMGDDWTRGELWQQAAAIPGVRVVADLDGREATRFGAATSGQSLLYGADGHLLFSGGLTPARGHAGDSAGHAALRGLLLDQPAGDARAAVFGCPLHDRTDGAPAGAP